MAILEVDLEDTNTGNRRTLRFSKSPIRIGRSPLNELPLDWPFVSHCHSVVHFDEREVRYVDLGSTNGSFVNNQRLERNLPYALDPRAPLVIGALRLVFRPGIDDARGGSRATYADLGKSGMWGMVPPVQASAPQANPLEGVERAYAAYRESWRQVELALMAAGQQLHATPKDAIVAELLTRCPELPQEASFRRWLGSEVPTRAPSAADPGAAAVGLAQRLGLPRPPSSDPFLDRTVELLARFAQAFVELRQGHDQFLANMGLARVSEASPLSTAREGRTILQYLLDPTSPPERLDELNRAYGDLMLHQLALVGAVVEGAKGIVGHLQPNALAAGGKPPGFFERIFGGGRLRALEARIADLSELKTLTNLLFGRDFERAYSSVLGRSVAATPSGMGAPRTLVEKS